MRSRLAVDSRLVAALARRNPNSPLVFHRNGIPIRRWRTAWRAACQAAGVPTRFLHDCRRTAARRPQTSGATPRGLNPGCSERIRNSRRTGRFRPLRSFSTSSPRPFQKRPMKPAYRDSWMCRKTRTAERPSGTSNVRTSDLSSLPRSLRAPKRFGKLKEFALWHHLIWMCPEFCGKAKWRNLLLT